MHVTQRTLAAGTLGIAFALVVEALCATRAAAEENERPR
jgi:hypothetical protein